MTTNLDERIKLAAQGINQALIQIRQRGISNMAFSQIALQSMRKYMELDSHWPIAWPFWPPGIIAKLIAAAQKITRRLLRWYIDPLVAQQNQFNQATLHTMQMLSYELQALRLQIEQNHLTDYQDRQMVLARLEALETALTTLTPPQPPRE